MAGITLDQYTIDIEVAARIRQINRLRWELGKIKDTLDRLGTDALLTLSQGNRKTPWEANDVNLINTALSAVIVAIDSANTEKLSIDSLAGFGF